MGDSYLGYLENLFNELKDCVDSEKYKIVNILDDDLKKILYNGNNEFLESKISTNIINEFSKSLVIDSENNEVVEDEILKNKILFAHIWYIINYNYNLSKEKQITVDEAFNNHSFLNYLILIKSILYLNNQSIFSPNVLYFVISTENLMLEYFVNNVFQKNYVKINKFDSSSEIKVIYKSGYIFFRYLETNFNIKINYELKKQWSI